MQSEPIDKLTERERQALRLVAQGYNNKQIAQLLNVTDLRAGKIILSANRKLGVSSRMDAARRLADAEQRGVFVIPGASNTLPPPPSPNPTLASEDGERQPSTLREERSPFGGAADLGSIGLPLRRRGERGNDLTNWQRAIWIAVAAAVGLLGVGVLAAGLAALSDQIIMVPSQGR